MLTGFRGPMGASTQGESAGKEMGTVDIVNEFSGLVRDDWSHNSQAGIPRRPVDGGERMRGPLAPPQRVAASS